MLDTIILARQAGAAQKMSKSRTSVAPILEPAAPFQVGETLDYRIGWSSFANAASLELSVPERRDLYGWQTWHFRTNLRTIRSVRALFPIDDQFDSYTDISTRESRQFETYRSELGKKETHILRLAPKGERSPAPGATVVVPPGTQDPLGALFELRGVDWQHRPEIRVPVFDGQDIYEMRAHVDGPPAQIRVGAGNFRASRIVIETFQNGGKNSNLQVAVWLANDREHTPILITADLDFGAVQVELISENPGANAVR